MKSVKDIPLLTWIALLLPVLLLGGALITYFSYQGGVATAAAERAAALEAEANARLAQVNSAIRSVRVEVIETGELLVRQIPQPLNEMPQVLLRELDQEIAERQTSWGQVTVVGLNPGTRQFHYEAREFQIDILSQAIQGESVGPRAIRTDEGLEFLIAEPLTNPDWIAVAQVREDGFRSALAQGLTGVGQVTLRQQGENGMMLYVLGDSPAGEPIQRATNIDGWVMTFAPSQAFLDRYAGGSGGLKWTAYTLFAAFLLSLGFTALTLVRQSQKTPEPQREAVDVEQPETRDEPAPPAKRSRQKAGKVDKKPGQSAPEERAETGDIGTPETATSEQQERRRKDDFEPLNAQQIPSRIFRANDIRGLVDEQITPQFARHLGRCFADFVLETGTDQVYLGRDTRLSSESLSQALAQGLADAGCDVIDIGLCPTPLLAWTMQHNGGSAAVMVTASHNPATYNGFKLMLGGTTWNADGIKQLREAMVRARFRYGEGVTSKIDPVSSYIEALERDLAPLRGLKVVVDAANGSAGPLAVKALSALGCQVVPLHCEPDGNFPNHEPDPSRPENIRELCERVKQDEAHFGIALDGDGDRLVAVSEEGVALDPDQLMMLFAEQVLTLNPASSVVSDVKSSRALTDFVEQMGGRSLLCRSGRSFVQSAFKESNAMLAGEYSSHYFFGDRWSGFDDGLYAACRLGEILVMYNKNCSEILSSLPRLHGTPEILIEVSDEEKFDIVQRFSDSAEFPGAKLLEIDGVRVEYSEAWGLLRASNTSPALTLRFEARSEEALEKIITLFREQLKIVAPDLKQDF